MIWIEELVDLDRQDLAHIQSRVTEGCSWVEVGPLDLAQRINACGFSDRHATPNRYQRLSRPYGPRLASVEPHSTVLRQRLNVRNSMIHQNVTLDKRPIAMGIE